jgi:sugar/nucleoside kinase (ribokinase family)
MASSVPGIVVAGHVCLDMIPTFPSGVSGSGLPALENILVPGKLTDVGPLTTATGGAVSNTGLALYRLGFPVSLMGKVGDDTVGHAILDILRDYDQALADGMIVTAESHSSYTVVINVPGIDRIFLHSPGANDTFGADDIDYTKLDGAKLFHFGYPPVMRRMFVDGGEELAALLGRVKARGLTTSLDMARPDPTSDAGKAPWRQILAKALPQLDLFLPSFDEVLYMLDRRRFDDMVHGGGDPDMQADAELVQEIAEELIEMGVAVVGLKLGNQGLYMKAAADPQRIAAAGACAPKDPATWAGREMLAPCFRTRVVGTTGSGDCTIAGFLGAFLRELSPEEVMTAAVAVGACCVEAADATSSIPEWKTVEQRIADHWQRLHTVTPHGWRWDEEGMVFRPGAEK